MASLFKNTMTPYLRTIDFSSDDDSEDWSNQALNFCFVFFPLIFVNYITFSSYIINFLLFVTMFAPLPSMYFRFTKNVISSYFLNKFLTVLFTFSLFIATIFPGEISPFSLTNDANPLSKIGISFYILFALSSFVFLLKNLKRSD